ncbi:hypothetical protein ACTFIY_003187 [Dictyostelium cf. discoideum]
MVATNSNGGNNYKVFLSDHSYTGKKALDFYNDHQDRITYLSDHNLFKLSIKELSKLVLDLFEININNFFVLLEANKISKKSLEEILINDLTCIQINNEGFVSTVVVFKSSNAVFISSTNERFNYLKIKFGFLFDKVNIFSYDIIGQEKGSTNFNLLSSYINSNQFADKPISPSELNELFKLAAIKCL